MRFEHIKYKYTRKDSVVIQSKQEVEQTLWSHKINTWAEERGKR